MIMPGHAFAWNMALRRAKWAALRQTACYTCHGRNLTTCCQMCSQYIDSAMRSYTAHQLPRMNTDLL